MPTYTENGVAIRETALPAGMTVIETYHPHATPWDYYGGKWLREMSAVLAAAGIESTPLVTHRTRTSPAGSGPNGRVRFGDAMMPGIYRIAVADHSESAARAALAAHATAIRAWLHDGAPMPAVFR